ncbi:polyprenyl synthetase family protein [Bacillus sp. SL00103]
MISILSKKSEQTVRSDYALLSEAGLHLREAGGKRIRPVLFFFQACLATMTLIKLNVVVLGAHSYGTFVHDDVIDDAELRRGKPTIKGKMGQSNCHVHRRLYVRKIA